MRALVTGGGGFLGQYLVERLLNDGVDVCSFSRSRHAELDNLKVEQRLGNLASFDDVEHAVQGCDAVFHIAAFPSISMDPRPYYVTNILGTRNIVAACLKRKVRRLVYTSTQCVANTIESQEGVDESTPFAPRFLGWYQMTKAIAEQFVRAANYAPWTDDYDFGGVDLSEKQFRSLHSVFEFRNEKRDPLREDTLMTVALRPHLIWGPRDRHLVPRLLQRARNGKLSRVGNGDNLLATIYVQNCADAHKLACDALIPNTSVPGSVYYVSQTEPLNCWKWIDDILALVNVPPVKKKISFKTAWTLGTALENIYRLAGWKSEPVMTRFLATQLAKSYWFNTAKARKELGFVPNVSTEEGMKRLKVDLCARFA